MNNNLGAVVRVVVEIFLFAFICVLIWVVIQSKREEATLQVKLAGAQVEIKTATEKLATTEEAFAEAEHKLDKAAKGSLWEYEGRFGPDFWGKVFPTCGAGKSQAPLDIKGPFAKAKTKLQLDYKLSSLKVIHNGHTVQVNLSPGSRLLVDGVAYELLQFHFHKPSEEWIDGKPSDMTLHLVHKSAEGKLAVLGVLLQSVAADNPGLVPIWTHLPTAEGPEQAFPETNVDPAKLIPSNLAYYQYEGSLTTPPCTEGVTFFILKTKMPISKAQLDAFPIHHSNARPVQPQNGRTIYSSD
ncbi:MAG: Carbonic anhydrase precursor [Pseudomonadota bacterium]|jgi:carbonic anhydrase